MTCLPTAQVRQAMRLIDLGKLDRELLDSTTAALRTSMRLNAIKDTTISRYKEQVATMDSWLMAEQTRTANWQAQVAITENYYKKLLRKQKRKTLGTGVLGILSTVAVAVILTR